MKFKTIHLFLLPLTVCCCHADPQEPPTPANPNEEIAGTYSGNFECIFYNGSSYPITVTPGTLKLLAVGTDTLKVEASAGCIYESFGFVLDTLTSTGSVWRGSGEYSGIWYYSANDSIAVGTPLHSSYGWLGRSFHGIKQ